MLKRSVYVKLRELSWLRQAHVILSIKAAIKPIFMRTFTWAAQAVSTVAVSTVAVLTAPIAVATITTAVTAASICIATSAAGMFRLTGFFCCRWCMLNRVPGNFAVVIGSCGMGHVVWAVFFRSQAVVVTVNVFQCSCSATSYKCLHDQRLRVVFVHSNRPVCTYAPPFLQLSNKHVLRIYRLPCACYIFRTAKRLDLGNTIQWNLCITESEGTKFFSVPYRFHFLQALKVWVLGNVNSSRYIQVPFINTGFAVFGKMCQLHTRNNTINIVTYIHTYVCTYRVSQEERTKLRESVTYVKLYRYNPKHLYPKLNGYGDNGQRKVWTSCISAYCTSTAV